MAVGLHAVNRSGLKAGDGAVVVGCGPVGLAVIAALKLLGVAPIVAADLSPARRALGATMGAHEVVDPREETAFAAWARVGGDRQMAVFEAVGVPGMIDELMRVAPAQSRIVVVGVCMQPDALTPMFGIAKELNVQFVLGYTPEEFAASLHSIAEGAIDVAPMITGQVGLDDVPDGVRAARRPRGALQDPRRARRSVVRMRLDPRRRPPAPARGRPRNFNESRYYNFYDAGAGLGGWVRMGNRPNEGYAELTVCLYLPDGRVGFIFKRPEIEGHTAHDAGGLRFEVVEPFVEHRVTLRRQGAAARRAARRWSTRARRSPTTRRVPCTIDLTHRAVGPAVGRRAGVGGGRRAPPRSTPRRRSPAATPSSTWP